MSHWGSGTRHNFRFDSINIQLRRERSINVALLAPRDRASIPTAPEPAHKSRNRASSIRGAMTLKSVSRSRSDVGLTFIAGGLLRVRPLYSPAIIRISAILFHAKTQREQRRFVAPFQPLRLCVKLFTRRQRVQTADLALSA